MCVHMYMCVHHSDVCMYVCCVCVRVCVCVCVCVCSIHMCVVHVCVRVCIVSMSSTLILVHCDSLTTESHDVSLPRHEIINTSLLCSL